MSRSLGVDSAGREGAVSRADALILEAATGVRELTHAELQEVLAHVAQAGFDPRPDKRGRTNAEAHYRKHVERFREWPPGTTLEAYLQSARRVILDPRSSVFTSRYAGYWQLAVIRRADELRGPGGSDWVVVEYRVELGHWTTVFQPRDLEHDFLYATKREHLRWLRRRS
uniref:Uncharacterized protein n=1 Tax=Thermorudis sp. TaxID=1969470 RepID=A0A7C2WCB5_9BACT